MTILLITAFIQYYICWVSYKNWFKNEITYCKMSDSYSFIGMILLLPVFVWIPIFPIVLLGLCTNFKYITLIWKT